VATDTPTTDRREVSVAEQDSVADRHRLRMDINLLESRINAEQTARLRVTTTNEKSRRGIAVAKGSNCPLFIESGAGSDEPEGLWLNGPGVGPINDRWVKDRPTDEPRRSSQEGCPLKWYDPGESVRNEYAVWDDYQVAGYLVPGTYRWEETIRIWNDSPVDPADPDTTITWGFALSIEVPG